MLGIISTILGTVAPVLEKLIPDPNQRLQLQAELQKAMVDQQTALLDAAKDVMVADAQSEGWLTRNARPCVVFWALGCITWIVAIAPVSAWSSRSPGCPTGSTVCRMRSSGEGRGEFAVLCGRAAINHRGWRERFRAPV